MSYKDKNISEVIEIWLHNLPSHPNSTKAQPQTIVIRDLSIWPIELSKLACHTAKLHLDLHHGNISLLITTWRWRKRMLCVQIFISPANRINWIQTFDLGLVKTWHTELSLGLNWRFNSSSGLDLSRSLWTPMSTLLDNTWSLNSDRLLHGRDRSLETKPESWISLQDRHTSGHHVSWEQDTVHYCIQKKAGNW